MMYHPRHDETNKEIGPLNKDEPETFFFFLVGKGRENRKFSTEDFSSFQLITILQTLQFPIKNSKVLSSSSYIALKHSTFGPLFWTLASFKYEGFSLLSLGDKPSQGDGYARVFFLPMYITAWHTRLVRC